MAEGGGGENEKGREIERKKFQLFIKRYDENIKR